MSWDVILTRVPAPKCECSPMAKALHALCCDTKVCRECGNAWPSETEDLHLNQTYNTTPMLRAAMAAVGCMDVREVDHAPASDVGAAVRQCIAWMELHREDLLPMEPANKWGSLDGLLRFLGAYALACEQYPLHRVRTE